MAHTVSVVWVDDTPVKQFANENDAKDLCKSVAGIVKETTPVEVRGELSTLETQ